MTRKPVRREVPTGFEQATRTAAPIPASAEPYRGLVGGIAGLLDAARRTSARTVNAIMTATYWEVGRRIVEYEQQGKARAEYGEALLERLSADLTRRCGRGFGIDNLERFRSFYLAWPVERISATLSRKSSAGQIHQAPSGRSDGEILPTASEESTLAQMASRFSLPWSAYVRLLAVKNEHARRFYETEALRGGWSVRQLDRQINSQFYERTAVSRNKAAMLRKGAAARPEDAVAPEEEVKDPYVLEFLGLKDEYSEADLEEALIRHLEGFLLELGGDFCFVARQRRLRIGDEWYRVDLVFYHRRLRCLVLIDLKLGRFTHADAGQMHTYLNYAAEHWTRLDEYPPVGLILYLVRAAGRSPGPLCPGQPAQQGAGRRIPNRPTGRAAHRRRAGQDEADLGAERGHEGRKRVTEGRGLMGGNLLAMEGEITRGPETLRADLEATP